MRVRSALSTTLLLTLTPLVVLASAAEPAHAASCQVTGSWGDGWTRSSVATCSQAQARVDRYIASYPTTYTGRWGSTSHVSASGGVNSGNAIRGKNSSGQISAWLWIN